MQKALHSKDNVSSLYVSRKDGRRGLTNFKDFVDATIQELEKIQKVQRKIDLDSQ